MKFLATLAGLVFLLTSVVVWAADPDADFDRLDGTGVSGKRVNVIEWEGNLEIHVYPAGSLKGLALKIDQVSKNKKVMVIGYRFDSNPKEQLIRRAILGIDLHEGFNVYKDLTADDYDKVIISNNGLALSNQLITFKTDPDPTQLYPDGHPALAKGAEKPSARKPAADREEKKTRRSDRADDEEGLAEGQIKPFRW